MAGLGGDALTLADKVLSIQKACMDTHEYKKALHVVRQKMASLETFLRELFKRRINPSVTTEALSGLDGQIERVQKVVHKVQTMGRAIYVLKVNGIREELSNAMNNIQFLVDSLQVGQIEGIHQTFERQWAEQDLVAVKVAAQERQENQQLMDALRESNVQVRAARVWQIVGQEKSAQLHMLLLEAQEECQVMHVRVASLKDSCDTMAQQKAQQEEHYLAQLVSALQSSLVHNPPSEQAGVLQDTSLPYSVAVEEVDSVLGRIWACQSSHDFEGIIHIMFGNLSDAHIQQKGCCALRVLCREDANRTPIATLGGIPAIVTAMTMHADESSVQKHGCAALRNLCVDSHNRSLVAKAGGIQVVMAAIQNHSSVASVQEHGCAALQNIARDNANNRTIIARNGGITIVVEAMKRHKGLVTVQEQGCAALQNLSRNNPKNRLLIADVGGIQAIVSAMTHHQGESGVQLAGCAALRNLSFNSDNNRTHIAGTGGIPAILVAMKEHKGVTHVQWFGCGALQNLAVDSNNQMMIAKLGGIPMIVAAMTEHKTVADVQLAGCGALRNLAWNNPDNQSLISRVGGIVATQEALYRFSDHSDIQDHGLCVVGWCR